LPFNELAYKEHHEGFVEYNHRIALTDAEPFLAVNGINEQNHQAVLDYGALYAVAYIQDPQEFRTGSQ
jgi:hypothetical protein